MLLGFSGFFGFFMQGSGPGRLSVAASEFCWVFAHTRGPGIWLVKQEVEALFVG